MKNIILVLTTLLLISACNNNESNQQNEFQTENATVYYQWVDIGFADVRCTYILVINNVYYCTDNLKLDHKSETNSIRVKVNYNVSDEDITCTSKIFNEPKNIKVIEILSIEKL